MGNVKTTFDLPDDLMRAIKLRAVYEDRKLKDLMAELLRRGLSATDEAEPMQRVQLPLVQCARATAPGEEMTPERIAAVLMEDEARGVSSG